MIHTERLTKQYGETKALDAVDLDVSDGAVYGLVGPNGAGKTTLLAIIAGLRKATSGSVSLAVDRSELAVLPDTPRFDSWLTAREIVDLARNVGRKPARPERVDEVLVEAGLIDVADRPSGGFSRGMLQRLGIASTMVNHPRLLLLDEPSSALDPVGRREVLDLVTRLRGEATVMFSSHILSDVQEVCDTVGVLRQGRLAYQGSVQKLLDERTTPRYLIRLRPPLRPVVAALENTDWVRKVTVMATDQLRVDVDAISAAERSLVGVLAAAAAQVVSLGPEAATLEDVVLEIVS